MARDDVSERLICSGLRIQSSSSAGNGEGGTKATHQLQAFMAPTTGFMVAVGGVSGGGGGEKGFDPGRERSLGELDGFGVGGERRRLWRAIRD